MLLLTLFFRHFPKLIDTGHVYVAKPPLFRVDAPARGKKPAAKIYALDEGELTAILDKLRKDGVREGAWSISRFKGLGEMSAEQLWETTLNPDTRRLLQVRLGRFDVHGHAGRDHQAHGQGRGGGAARADGAARRRRRGGCLTPCHPASGAPAHALGRVLLASCSAQPLAHAADIYGYVDEKGVAHFAPEKLDERYQLFFRGGQSFDTADGIGALRARSRRQDRRQGAARLADPARAVRGARPATSPPRARCAMRRARHAIDYELLQALIATESGFDAQAVSPKGALGLMQLMPATAQRYGVQADKRGSLEKKLFDPRINIATGSRYLSDLIAMFPGNIELALAAYNAGEGAVQRAGNKIPNYPETQNYVKTVLQLYAYLKPAAAAGGGKAPGRVRMELAPPRGGALGRGNLPADARGDAVLARAAAGAAGSTRELPAS